MHGCVTTIDDEILFFDNALTEMRTDASRMS